MRLTWATFLVPVQPRIYSESLSQTKQGGLERAQLFEALAVLAEDMASVLSTRTVACNHL